MLAIDVERAASVTSSGQGVSSCDEGSAAASARKELDSGEQLGQCRAHRDDRVSHDYDRRRYAIGDGQLVNANAALVSAHSMPSASREQHAVAGGMSVHLLGVWKRV